MTRKDAIEFCENREWYHKQAAKHITKTGDIVNCEVDRIRYQARLDLANKYKEIAELLKDKNE